MLWGLLSRMEKTKQNRTKDHSIYPDLDLDFKIPRTFNRSINSPKIHQYFLNVYFLKNSYHMLEMQSMWKYISACFLVVYSHFLFSQSLLLAEEGFGRKIKSKNVNVFILYC